MLNSRAMLFFTMLSSIMFIFFVSGCKTTTSEASVDQPLVQDSPEPEQIPEMQEPLSQEAIDDARNAVRRANLIGANRYYPAEYRQLLENLNNGISLGNSDPDSARLALKTVIDDSNTLYNQTVEARYEEFLAQYQKNDAALKSVEADEFALEEYSKTQELGQHVITLYQENKLADALMHIDETLTLQARLHHNLSENIRYVGILRRDTENYISDAEDNEAFIYAADELGAANAFYFLGLSQFGNYNLEESAGTLAEAKMQAVKAARIAKVRKQQFEADRMLVETQERLESASIQRASNPDGSVSEPNPWEGAEYLESNPLIDHGKNVDPVEMFEIQLRKLDAPLEDDLDQTPSDVPIENEGTQVNADEQNTHYLALAEDLWEKGVQARNDGEFDLANDYFRQSQVYIDAYEANIVSKTYTVVYREVETDCLWRISERVDVFDNPFLWPKIWRANKRIIQNPDLIYPGQVLLIPPN